MTWQRGQVVRAQFGGPFDAFASLRRRRSEIEYPRYPGDTVTAQEAVQVRELTRCNRLLEQENEVLRRAAAHLSQANPPGEWPSSRP